MVEAFLALAANVAARSSRHMKLLAIDARTARCSRRAAQSAVALARDGLLQTAGADVDGALVR